MPLVSWIYNGILILLLFFSLPKIAFQRLTKGKYKNIFRKKSGQDFFQIDRIPGPRVWIHAVSVGETKAVQHFTKLLKKQYPDLKILVTSMTDTGHEEAKRSLPYADHHLYLPFDFSWIINPVVRHIKPDLVILSETDYWFHFLNAAKKEGASVAVINGKISDSSLGRYRFLGPFLNTFFAPVDFACVQSERYQERLLKLGIPQEKIAVTGNLKLDSSPETLPPEELARWKEKLGILQNDLVLVCGSTHNPEEALFIQAYKALKNDFTNLKLILVPRHPERFDAVASLLEKEGISATRFSQIDSQIPSGAILMDAMGKLKICYQMATLAIVGGSFTSLVGGHNILEPSAYGVPVLFGPYMHTQLDFVDLIDKYHAGKQVKEDHLLQNLRELLSSPIKRKPYSEAGKQLTQDLQGASERTLKALENKLNLAKQFQLHENSKIG